jgi:alpha-beta hydrolase superfamily lysophospholipase
MKRAGKFLIVILMIYIIICGWMYFMQESLIFFPEKVDKNFTFQFDIPFEELYIKTADSALLHGILFKADTSKGVIFYLHGNAGSLRRWGDVATTYRNLNYDLFMLDYRGYGKSEGAISSEEQLYQDIQSAYDSIKVRYPEDRIIILGFSIGTGPAAKLASSNNPQLLILQAPYYNLTDMMEHRYPLIPTAILKYKFETNRYLQDVDAPVVIFHGDDDEVISHGSSVKLKELFKEADTLITLEGQGHNGMRHNEEYTMALDEILGEYHQFPDSR